LLPVLSRAQVLDEDAQLLKTSAVHAGDGGPVQSVQEPTPAAAPDQESHEMASRSVAEDSHRAVD
jgi:hypothetical protein